MCKKVVHIGENSVPKNQCVQCKMCALCTKNVYTCAQKSFLPSGTHFCTKTKSAHKILKMCKLYTLVHISIHN